jgi:hypothetical protein
MLRMNSARSCSVVMAVLYFALGGWPTVTTPLAR